MTDLCHLCDYHTTVNEARERGDETWRTDNDPYGVNVFVIPKGQKPDIALRRDGTIGPQRVAWYNEIPERCECGERVKLKHPASSWKPDVTEVAPDPSLPMFEPTVEERERLSLV